MRIGNATTPDHLYLQVAEGLEKMISDDVLKIGDKLPSVRMLSEEYGISIDQIKEVVITPTITRVPQKPAFIKGVANIRGNIIAILDLEQKFGLQKAEDTMPSNNNFTLVIDSNEYKMGVLVKEVPNTLSIS